jgi:hypothetical protein
LSKQFDRDYLFEKSRPAILVIRLARLPKEASGRLIPEAGDTYDEVERHVMRDARLEKDYWLRTVIMPGYNREPWYGLAVYQRRDVVLDPAGAWLPERLYQKPPV